MNAPLPADEEERLRILRRYKIIDSGSDQVFDDLTALAAHICQAPIALISLIDEDRQWFKSKVGLATSETSRDISFCAHAILQPSLFIVEDALSDERFATNPLVLADPEIRFYAGAPLVSPEGHALGTLCVIDNKPRQMSPEHRQALSVLSRHVSAQLELRRKTAELTESVAERDRVQAALERANEELEERVRQRTDELTTSYARLALLSRAMLRAQESERRNIARELHDEVGQLLTGLKLLLDIATSKETGSAPEVAEAKRLAQDLMQRIRQLSLNLRPHVLDDLGLRAALEWHCRRVSGQSQIPVQCDLRLGDERFDTEVETGAFRIVQEALTNVVRHAQASRISIGLWEEDGHLCVEVKDDGTGFDVEAALAGHNSNGLSGIRERVHLLNGTLDLHSTPAKGTTVLARLPSLKR